MIINNSKFIVGKIKPGMLAVFISCFSFIPALVFADPVPICPPNGNCDWTEPEPVSLISVVGAWLVFAIIFNYFVDSIVLLLVAKVLLKVKASFRKYILTILIIGIAGLIADFGGVLAISRQVQSTPEDPLGLLIIFFFVAGCLIALFDFLICRKILQISNKKALIIGLSMAVLTNPALWAGTLSIFKG